MLLIAHLLGASGLLIPTTIIALVFVLLGIESTTVFFLVAVHLFFDLVVALGQVTLLLGEFFDLGLDLAHFVVGVGFVVDLGDGWLPVGSQVDLTSWLTLVLNGEPLVPILVTGEGGQFADTFSNLFVLAWIVVLANEFKIVTKVLNLKFPSLAFPLWVLATTLTSSRLPCVLARLHFDVWVHLANQVSLAGEFSLD